MNPTAIKIYGERNTGTNYLYRLIEQNLDVALLPGVAPRYLRRLFPSHPTLHERLIDSYFRWTFKRNLGWKHMLVPQLQSLQEADVAIDRVLFLFLVKNPYAWLLSLYRRPYHNHRPAPTFEAFLREQWPTVGRERAGRPYFPNPIVLWNEKTAAYVRLAQQVHGSIIRYEDLIADPQVVLQNIARKGVSWKSKDFKNIAESVKGDEGKDFHFYQTYYLEEQWRKDLSQEAIRFINVYLDEAILQKLGYHVF